MAAQGSDLRRVRQVGEVDDAEGWGRVGGVEFGPGEGKADAEAGAGRGGE